MAQTSDPRWRLGLRTGDDGVPGPVDRSLVPANEIVLYLRWLRTEPSIDVALYHLPGGGWYAWGPAAWCLAVRLDGVRLRVGDRPVRLSCEPKRVAHDGGRVMEARLVSPRTIEPWLCVVARSWLRCRVLAADGSIAAWQDERHLADGRLLTLPGDWRRPARSAG